MPGGPKKKGASSRLHLPLHLPLLLPELMRARRLGAMWPFLGDELFLNVIIRRFPLTPSTQPLWNGGGGDVVHVHQFNGFAGAPNNLNLVDSYWMEPCF